MDYEAYKAAALEELTSEPSRSKNEWQFVADPTNTSSFSLVCGMLMAAVIGFLATDTDLPLLKQLKLNANGRDAIGSVLGSLRPGASANVAGASTKRSLASHFESIAALREKIDYAEEPTDTESASDQLFAPVEANN